MTLRIDLFGRYTLKCPECGREYDSRDGYFTCKKCGIELWTEKECWKYRKRGKYKPNPDTFDGDAYARFWTNVATKCGALKGFSLVECPYCGSGNTRKITSGDLIFTTKPAKMFKEWHCNSCGSDF